MVVLLTIADVCKAISFSKAFIYSQIKTGNFPEPIKFGKCSRWKASEIYEWIDNH